MNNYDKHNYISDLLLSSLT